MSLFLHEEIFLLALKDEQGTIAFGAHANFAVGGAVMAQLLLDGKISLSEDKKPKVLIRNASDARDPLLNDWLSEIAERKKPRTMQDWVSRIANSKNLKHRVAGELCRKHILRMDEDKVLLLFTRKIYPEINPRPERELIARVERAIFDEGAEVDPRTAVLVALAHRANILKVVIEKDRLKRAKKRIEEIGKGDASARATKEAIAAMQAAVLVATVIVPTVTS
jgi:hypothetical protein